MNEAFLGLSSLTDAAREGEGGRGREMTNFDLNAPSKVMFGTRNGLEHGALGQKPRLQCLFDYLSCCVRDEQLGPTSKACAELQEDHRVMTLLLVRRITAVSRYCTFEQGEIS